MTDRMIGLIFIFFMLLVSLAFQLQCKQLATELAVAVSKLEGTLGRDFRSLLREVSWLRLFIVLALAGLTFVLWLLALVRLELSFALVFASAGLAFSTVASALILNEPMTVGRLVGVSLVVVGLVTTATS